MVQAPTALSLFSDMLVKSGEKADQEGTREKEGGKEVKTVTRFESSSGRIFTNKEDATKDESLFNDVQKALNILPQDNSCNFANGDGYYQLTLNEVRDFRQAYRDVIEKHLPDLLECFDKLPGGIIGRFLADGDSHAYRLWGKYCCIDSHNRLWGQQYFANHPSEGKQVNLSIVHTA